MNHEEIQKLLDNCLLTQEEMDLGPRRWQEDWYDTVDKIRLPTRLYLDQDNYDNVIKVSFSSCQRNLIKTFQIEAIIALITKMAMIFS